MAIGIGILVVFLIIGLLPIRGWKGFGIKFGLLVLGALAMWFLPGIVWSGEEGPPEWWWNVAIPVPEKLGSMIGGSFLGPIGAILGFFPALIMAFVLKPKAD